LTRCCGQAVRKFRRRSIILLCLGLVSNLGSRQSAAYVTGDDFFRAPALWAINVSPTGEFFAADVENSLGRTAVFFESDRLDSEEVGVFIRHIQSKTTKAALKAEGIIYVIKWVDDDTLFVSYKVRERYYDCSIDVEYTEGELSFDVEFIRTPGWMVHGIPNQKDEILWAYAKKKQTIVYRAPLAKLEEFQPRKRGRRSRPWKGLGDEYIVAQLDGSVPLWITDRDGVVRGAVGVYEGDTPEVALWYRETQSTPWRELYRTDDIDEVLIPVGISSDNRNLLVLSNKKSDTTSLVEFEVDSGELGRVLFSHPSADVQSIMYDSNGMEVLTAVYEEAGLRRYHHFNAFSDRFQRSLEHAFPGKSIAITSTSRDSRYFSVLVSSPQDAGTFYILDTEDKVADLVDQTMPWLDPDTLSDAQVLEVTSRDGTKLEAFLTIPAELDGELPPLLVLPHGGPYGVRDSRRFDPLVQYIASWGIAVLQVNFRGSAGYGKSFAEAGHQERAKGIEDDIEAAVELVIENGLIDSRRMCIGGISYGGYSAIVSAMRKPDRYLCAVTVAGVSDLPLQLHSNLQGATKRDKEDLKKVFGDPTTEYEEMAAISPVYRADEIEIPVLIVHGTEDRRVDVEHAYRLKAMLEAHGKTYSWHLMQGVGHSPDNTQMLEVARVLTMFVDDHLHAVEIPPDEPAGD
jgi:dipeptidyl aminopeptidase/acylaminoacyl peptidase